MSNITTVPPLVDSIAGRMGRALKRALLVKNWKVLYDRREPLPDGILHLRNGLDIHYADQDPIVLLFNEAFVFDCYLKGFHHLKPNDIVLDVGANIGLFALVCQSKAPGVTVHCFEPSRDTRDRLLKNITANRLQESVRVYPFGVSDKKKRIKLYSALQSGSRSIYKTPAVNADLWEEIDCLPWSGILQEAGVTKVDLLKVDVEGAEREMFEGIQKGALDPVGKIAVEYHNGAGSKRDVPTSEYLIKQLTEHGFKEIEVIENPPRDQSGLIRASR